jgi:hypothetical protein
MLLYIIIELAVLRPTEETSTNQPSMNTLISMPRVVRLRSLRSLLLVTTIPFIAAAGATTTFQNTMHRSANLTSLRARIPKGTWDTHMHVIDPRVFPLDPSAQYQPEPHTLEQAEAFLGGQLGIQKMVIVQPSIYANDNDCTLDGLRRLGKNGRAIVQFDPASTSNKQLREWHDLGVRGVRLNFKSVGETPSAETLEADMRSYAEAVRDLGWALELYISMENIPLLEKFANDLGVKIIVSMSMSEKVGRD